MKAKLLILLLLVSNLISAQVIDVVSNLESDGVSNLTYKGNYIYFNKYIQKKVYRFDYTSANNSPELVYSFNENPNFIYEKDNVLYVGVENSFKTYKIDLSVSNAQPIVIANVSGPMAQIGNYLYIGQYGDSKIVRLDLITNVQTDILVGYKPNFFTVKNNELYFTSNFTNKLYKLNVSTNSLEIILDNLNYSSGIVMNDDFLFICESSGNSISFYSQPSFQIDNLYQLGQNSWPNGIININDDLYFVQTVAGKISKLTLNRPLSNSSFTNTKSLITKVYPNPTTDKLSINSAQTFEKYGIYDSKGVLILNSKLVNNEINVSSLSKGVYSLVLDNYSQTFIKE